MRVVGLLDFLLEQDYLPEFGGFVGSETALSKHWDRAFFPLNFRLVIDYVERFYG